MSASVNSVNTVMALLGADAHSRLDAHHAITCRDLAWSVVVEQFLHIPYPKAFLEERADQEDQSQLGYHPGMYSLSWSFSSQVHGTGGVKDLERFNLDNRQASRLSPVIVMLSNMCTQRWPWQ